jgi:proline iminopeptidase
MAHGAFIEEGQLLRNAINIAHIPTVIINGRYDFICPPKTAYKLHQVLPKSKLVIVEGAGHSGNEPAMEKALVEAINLFDGSLEKGKKTAN